jgi:hypothetical protein
MVALDGTIVALGDSSRDFSARAPILVGADIGGPRTDEDGYFTMLLKGRRVSEM